jgi:nucleoside-diphosphate-sugar epimerase
MHLEKRVLVTGGAGFLGSHLCERLLERGADLVCVDNFFTGAKRNIAHIIGNKRFELVRHDVTFPLYVEVDEIYNLACPASPVHQTTKTSVHGAINMLGLAKRLRAKILQASSMAIPTSIHSRRSIGATSTRSGPGPVMMKASAAPRPCSSTTGASTGCASRWRASLTPTARGCIPTTAAWCRTSSSRR